MRTPENHPSATYNARTGKKYEEDLNMTYLGPGAFTVLQPPERGKVPDPPSNLAPSHRLPNTTKRHRHQSFAIIGEVNQNNPESRSTSPTGRVSPFKGRGFNPAGSRLASPSASPIPPDDPRTVSPRNGLSGLSKIPVRRRGSNGELFGEKVFHNDHHVTFNNQLSKSLSNLAPKNLSKKTTQPNQKPSPRKRHKTLPAFNELSPIAGSSPEPSNSVSSPSRIPTKSRSTPPSRRTSPTRGGTRSNVPSRSNSRARSRDPSPSQIPSPVRVPAHKRYQNVQPKIDTHHKPKNNISSDQSEDSDAQHRKRMLSRQKSVNRTGSRHNLLPKTQNYSNKNVNNYTSDSSDQGERKKVLVKRNSNSKIQTNNFNGVNSDINNVTNNSHNNERVFNPPNDQNSSKNGSRLNLTDLGLDKISPNSVISNTTNTVTKPLHIDIESRPSSHKSPLVDGRVLSATSVTQAINKMNDTVLNTQTLIKENSFYGSRRNLGLNGGGNNNFDLHEAVKTIDNEIKTVISASDKKDVVNKESKSEGDKKENDKIKTTEEKTAKIPPNNTISVPTSNNTTSVNSKLTMTQSNNNSNHVNNNNNQHNHVLTIGVNNPTILDSDVEKTMNRLLGSRENSLSSIKDNKLSANDRIREQRTVIAADVKPIRITVREKPTDGDVQSGNIGVHGGISNGLNERPSLPPTQNQSPPPSEQPSKDEPPQNACRRFFTSCTQKLSCNRCKTCRKGKKTEKTESQEELHQRENQEEVKPGCLSCLTKKLHKNKRESEVRINIEEDETQPKPSFWQKLKCWKNCKRNKNKIQDSTGCCPIGKRKTSWLERPESVLDSAEPLKAKCCSKEGCKNFFASLFCCRCCRKKKVEEIPVSARKESMVSSKKKSLTPGTTLPPPEDIKPKIDASLVEHTSHMKAAIPVLPVWLAWFCCVLNCIGPGVGTILSGLFCLCIGKPRFSQKDGPRPRIGAFIIDLVIGFSQCFTILFCLVGWGWSIWWGVIMVKIAKRHKKLKHLENLEEVAARPIAIGQRRQQETKT